MLNDIFLECVWIGMLVLGIYWRGEENLGRFWKCMVEIKYGGNVNCYYVIVIVLLGVL